MLLQVGVIITVAMAAKVIAKAIVMEVVEVDAERPVQVHVQGIVLVVAIGHAMDVVEAVPVLVLAIVEALVLVDVQTDVLVDVKVDVVAVLVGVQEPVREDAIGEPHKSLCYVTK